MKRLLKCSAPPYLFVAHFLVCMLLISISYANTIEEHKLPEKDDIFTIAFNINGLKKESRNIYRNDELGSILSSAVYLGGLNLQLKQPLSDFYWCQDGIVVLKNKTVFSFTVYEEKNNNQKTYISVYFGDGSGVHLYKLPLK